MNDEEEKENNEFNIKCIRNVMNNFEDALCERMQLKVDEVKEYIKKQEKEIEQKDKIINLMINDLQEYVYNDQCKEEILEYYKNM